MTTTILARFDDAPHAEAMLARLTGDPDTETRLCDGRGDDAPLGFTRAREGAIKGAMMLAPVTAAAGALVAWLAGGGAVWTSWLAVGGLFGTLLGTVLGAIAGASDPIVEPLTGGNWLAVRAHGAEARRSALDVLVEGGATTVVRR